MLIKNRLKSKLITLDQYSDLCLNSDVSPNYLPDFVDYYFGQLKKKTVIIGRYEKHSGLIAAYPVMQGQIFPNSLHKRSLGRNYDKLGDIGQPEALFPIIQTDIKFYLNRISPVTSPILGEAIKTRCSYSLKSMAISTHGKHKSAKRAKKRILNEGGNILFTDEGDIDINDFADIYIRLHGKKRGLSENDLRFVKHQITNLSKHVSGGILLKNDEPMAAHLCYICEGKTIYYVDAINIGVKMIENPKWYESYGSILLLASKQKAEKNSEKLGKKLRYSYGYYYGSTNYKNQWTKPEPTFLAF